jgi:hypothetical protein
MQKTLAYNRSKRTIQHGDKRAMNRRPEARVSQVFRLMQVLDWKSISGVVVARLGRLRRAWCAPIVSPPPRTYSVSGIRSQRRDSQRKSNGSRIRETRDKKTSYISPSYCARLELLSFRTLPTRSLFIFTMEMMEMMSGEGSHLNTTDRNGFLIYLGRLHRQRPFHKSITQHQICLRNVGKRA